MNFSVDYEDIIRNDIACFEVGKGEKVQIIHDFWDWLKDAVLKETSKYCISNEDINYITCFYSYAIIGNTISIFFTAGTDDPVGDYGKGVKKVYNKYKEIGIKDGEVQQRKTV